MTGVWGQRYTVSLMSFLAIFCCHNMRSNLNIAIIAMVNSSECKTPSHIIYQLVNCALVTAATTGNETAVGKECLEEGNIGDIPVRTIRN